MAVIVRAVFDTIDTAELAAKQLGERGISISARNVGAVCASASRNPDAFAAIADFSPLPSVSAMDGIGLTSFQPAMYGTNRISALNDGVAARRETALEISVPEEQAAAACEMLRSRGGYHIWRGTAKA